MSHQVAAAENGPKISNRAIGKGPAEVMPKYTNVARGKPLASVSAKKKRK